MAQPETPETFGKYQLLEKIATGGMAEVWRARAQGMAGFEKILVIKKILPKLLSDQEFIELFIDEARIAVHLLHVNIVQVFDLGAVDGQYFMAMEYVHGLDLSRIISRARNIGPVPIPLALFMVAEVLKALRFAHERTDEDGRVLSIVHCDMSPQNILISYAGEVKLTDFGISRAAFQAAEKHKVVRGKYAYMSPEQVDGKALDGRTDIFSLGIVLFELVTARRLFKMRSRDETLQRVRRAEVPSPRAFRPEISEDLEGILLRALSRRPEARYQSAGDMLEALSALMVREGHRVTNNDVAAYLRQVIDAAAGGNTQKPGMPGRSARSTAIVVLAIEAAAPPRSLAKPKKSLIEITQQWASIIGEHGGEIWENGDGSMLLVWLAHGGLRDAISRTVEAAVKMQQATHAAGYRLSAGVAPGVARLSPDTRRPSDGWELAGPFYLARWMMNLSAHRGRVLLTEVAARQVHGTTAVLGRIPIQGNRYINLHELG
ncbi:MAG: tRNA A-37 threonylcarbamoyl transferase component Bud32 [Myxococcota bacterium]